ncbi:MAG: hypothetical protein ACOC33_02110 [bacterium]
MKNNIINEAERYLNENFHPKDDLLRGITYEELIITVQSNVKDINEETVTKEFNDILDILIDEAKYELKENMDVIIKEAKR